MGISSEEQGVIPIEELGNYTHRVAAKRRELLLAGDTDVFAANSLMRTIADVRHPKPNEAQILRFMTSWEQMGEEPSGPLA